MNNKRIQRMLREVQQLRPSGLLVILAGVAILVLAHCSG